jgi:hypothetical protein
MQSDFSKCILLLIFLTLTMVAFILIFNEIVGGVNISLNKYSTPCDSHETFFEERCLRIGSVDSCPRNMALFDGPNNRGFCDCWVLDDKPAFYSNETGECSLHNTQVSCIITGLHNYLFVIDWKLKRNIHTGSLLPW